MIVNSARHDWMVSINDVQILTHSQENQGVPGQLSPNPNQKP